MSHFLKNKSKFFYSFLTGLILSGHSGVSIAAPDVKVSAFSLGTPIQRSDGSFAIRANITVRNAGTTTANKFKLSAEANGLAISPSVYYTVALQAVSGIDAFGQWYVFTTTPLAPGANHSFTARIILSKQWDNRFAYIKILGDSCAGDEFMESYCRIKESIETNNYSPIRSVQIP